MHEEVFEGLYKGTPNAVLFGPLTRDPPETGTKGYFCKGDFNTHLPGHDLTESYISDSIALVEQRNDPNMQLGKDEGFKMYVAGEKQRKAV